MKPYQLVYKLYSREDWACVGVGRIAHSEFEELATVTWSRRGLTTGPWRFQVHWASFTTPLKECFAFAQAVQICCELAEARTEYKDTPPDEDFLENWMWIEHTVKKAPRLA